MKVDSQPDHNPFTDRIYVVEDSHTGFFRANLLHGQRIATVPPWLERMQADIKKINDEPDARRPRKG